MQKLPQGIVAQREGRKGLCIKAPRTVQVRCRCRPPSDGERDGGFRLGRVVKKQSWVAVLGLRSGFYWLGSSGHLARSQLNQLLWV